MDQARWQRIQALFVAALDLDPAEREDWLAATCGEDRELRDELLSLLAADASAPAFLDGSAADLADLPGGADPARGSIGPYELLRLIGAGGMGDVFLARRAGADFEQHVALKIIRDGFHSEEIIQRFQAERRILAQLEHPHIARLLDGGLTDDGRSYFTMEYVAGEPIDAYCAGRNATLDQRLALFQTVCAAVQHAQSKLIIHRDLKPSNVLVTPEGMVKLLDFGIAKLLDEDESAAGERALMTRTGHRVMTLAYAAPEQVRGEPVSTATDVYSLGVILYELLTGSRPYTPADDSGIALERAICETEPARPSRVSGVRLDRDLDRICLKALSKEPERRYASPAGLAEDIQRFRDNRPVLARPATWRYRGKKYLRRHRLALSLLGSMLAILLAMGIYYTARLAAERNRARLEAAKAAQVAEFLTSIFTVADPSESRGEAVTARELLDRGAARIHAELAPQPALQADMLDIVGRVYHSLGLYSQADSLLAMAVGIHGRIQGVEHLDYAASLHRLGSLKRDAGETAAADSLLSRALALHRRQLAPDDPRLARVLDDLAVLTNMRGDYEQAERLYREAEGIWDLHPEGAYPEAANGLNNLALLLLETGQYEAAETMFRRALDQQRRWLGVDHPEVATTLFNLALLKRETDELVEAEALHREALALDRQVYGEKHPNVAYSLHSLATLLVELGEYDDAEALHREALSMRRELLGDKHPEVVSSLNGLARTLHDKGDYAGAEPLYREVVASTRRLWGDMHPQLAGRLNHLGWLFSDLGRYAEAESLHYEALAIHEAVAPADERARAISLRHIARCQGAQGRLDEAEAAQREALSLSLNTFGEQSPFTAANLGSLGRIHLLRGEFAAADSLYRRTNAIMREQFGADSPRTISAEQALAGLLHEQGELDAARDLFTDCLSRRLQYMPSSHPTVAWTQVQLGGVFLDLGRGAEAEYLLVQARPGLQASLPPGHHRRAQADSLLLASRQMLSAASR